MIGKRKRDTSVVSRPSATEESSPSPAKNAQDVFRKYFEAQFEPLDLPAAQTTDEEDSVGKDEEDELDSPDLESEWEGLEDVEDEGDQVEVVEHRHARLEAEDMMDKKARKAFMNAKPPSSATAPTTKPTNTNDDDEGDNEAIDAENLKHDLALQRLLRESHLLDSASELAPTGKNRLKALDLRLQALGAKASLYEQQKMPSFHRRGIKAKAASKEEKRRREAKENGIILEKPAAKKSKAAPGRRERGVGNPSIGKFSGGTLNLGKRDLMAVEGSKRGSGKRGSGKGKRRR